jgi:hypothetical protein
MSEVPEGLEVHRAPMTNDRLCDLLAVATGSRIADGLRWRLRERFSVPDLYALWRRPAVKTALRAYRTDRFDAIYATGYPWTALLVGHDVSRTTGVPLLADFRDPWVGDDTFRLERPLDPREVPLEKSVIRAAAIATCVSETMTEDLRKAYPNEPDAKFRTVWNGFDAEDLAEVETVSKVGDGIIRIAYTGVFRPQYGPQLLYEAVKRLHEQQSSLITRLRLVTAGFPPGQARAYGIEQYVDERGVVSHREALTIMKQADAAFAYLPPGSFARFAMPGKIYEYLGSGTPVFAVAPLDSELDRFFHRVGGGIVVPSSVNDVAAIVEQVCKTGRLSVPSLNPEALRSFQRRSQTASLAGLLSEIKERS